MPYNPDLGGRDPLSTLFALQQLQQGIQARREQAQAEALGTAMRLIEAGGDASSLAPMVRPELQGSIAQIQQAAARQRQQRGLENVLQLAPSIAAASAPYYNESGQLITPTPEAAAQYKGTLSNLSQQLGLDPQTSALAESLVGTNVAAKTADVKERRAAEVRNDREVRARQAQGAALDRSNAQFRAVLESAEYDRRQAIERGKEQEGNWASRIAAVNAGIAPPQEATAVAQEMTNAGVGGDTSRRVQSLARSLASQHEANLALREASDTKNVSAAAEYLGVSENEIRAAKGGFATWDPAKNTFAPGQYAATWANQRLSLVQASGELDGLEAAFRSAQEEAGRDPLTGGPIVGGQAMQGFFQSMGRQNTAAAEYSTRMSSFLLSTSNALVPGVPSNMDMRFVLAQIPTLEELFSGSAEGRFRALRDIQQIALEAPHNKALGAQVSRAGQNRAGMAEAQSMVQDFSKDGDFGKFNQRLGKWKARYGAQFRVDGVSADAQPGTDGGSGFADEFFDAHMGGP